MKTPEDIAGGQEAGGLSGRPSALSTAERLLWIVALHSEACRLWLTRDPPELEEAVASLEAIRRNTSLA